MGVAEELRDRRGKMKSTKRIVTMAGAACCCVAVAAFSLWPAPAPATSETAADPVKTASIRPIQRGPSGLPLPRFVSLKSDRINVRSGPGQDYPVSWIFTRAGLPVEIVAEFDNWRRIRDSEGAEGWVYHSLLSGRRTALVTPWEKEGEPKALHAAAADSSRLVARLASTLLLDVHECNGAWCYVTTHGHNGYIAQSDVWGVYPGELFEE